MRKVISIGVFDRNLIHQASPYCGDNVFAKGLEANGFKVFRLDYRAEENPDRVLLELAERIKPTLFWFGKCERISCEAVKFLRRQFPDSVFIKWAADVRDKPVPFELEFNKSIDWFFATFGGEWLKSHLLPSMRGVASIVAFTDSEYFHPMKVDEEWKSEVLFTGRTNMIAEVDRASFLRFLIDNGIPLTWYGQHNWLEHPEYLYAINGAKIGLGLHHFIRPLYSSDRLGNYLACGTFYLSQYFPGIERVFKRAEEIDWFKTKEECLEKIEYYLKNDRIREEIAKRGRKKVLKYFDYKPLVKNLLYIIKNKRSKYPWDDVFLN